MLIQICASQNDLFGLDGDGIVYQYDFNTNNWMKLGHGRRDRGESSPAENAAPPGRGWAAHHEEMPVNSPNEFDRARSVPTGARAPSMRTLAVAILLVAGLHGTLGIAHADVPTAKDIATCNREAQAGVRDRAVSPTSKDEAGAGAARKASAEGVERPGETSAVTQSADPQIHGMEGEGAKDAAYRGAYRVCMRQKGF